MNFIKNIYLRKLEKNLRILQDKKANALKKSKESEHLATAFLISAKSANFLTLKTLDEISKKKNRAMVYRHLAKSYEADTRKVAEKIAKLKV